MKKARLIAVPAAIASSLLGGCDKLSESVLDDSVGMNGGFEITESGLPVNWFVYTPATIPTGDYDLVIDTIEYKGGKQSLKFVVRDCSSVGGRHSHGFSKEYEATSGVTYLVGFWVKNDGAQFFARVGGVSTFGGEYETIVQSSDTISAWRHNQHAYTMPEEFHRLRLEVNVLSPGTFWVDDITITATVPDPATGT